MRADPAVGVGDAVADRACSVNGFQHDRDALGSRRPRLVSRTCVLRVPIRRPPVEPEQGDLAQLGHGLGRARSRRRCRAGVAARPGSRPPAAGRPDQEHPVEALLVCRVAGREPARPRRAGSTPDCSRAGERGVVPGAGPLADPRVPGQRGRQLLVGELGRGRLGRGGERGQSGVRAAVAATSATQRGTARQVSSRRVASAPGDVEAGDGRRVAGAVEARQGRDLRPPTAGCGREWIGLASATRSSNRCVAILAISSSAAGVLLGRGVLQPLPAVPQDLVERSRGRART